MIIVLKGEIFVQQTYLLFLIINYYNCMYIIKRIFIYVFLVAFIIHIIIWTWI